MSGSRGATCRHCGVRAVSRPRGLCWGCYHAPGVRELYPSASNYARRGVGDRRHAAPPAAHPTDAEPGTEAKVSVMEARAARGEAIFHPRDARRGLT